MLEILNMMGAVEAETWETLVDLDLSGTVPVDKITNLPFTARGGASVVDNKMVFIGNGGFRSTGIYNFDFRNKEVRIEYTIQDQSQGTTGLKAAFLLYAGTTNNQFAVYTNNGAGTPLQRFFSYNYRVNAPSAGTWSQNFNETSVLIERKVANLNTPAGKSSGRWLLYENGEQKSSANDFTSNSINITNGFIHIGEINTGSSSMTGTISNFKISQKTIPGFNSATWYGGVTVPPLVLSNTSAVGYYMEGSGGGGGGGAPTGSFRGGTGGRGNIVFYNIYTPPASYTLTKVGGPGAGGNPNVSGNAGSDVILYSNGNVVATTISGGGGSRATTTANGTTGSPNGTATVNGFGGTGGLAGQGGMSGGTGIIELQWFQ